MKPVEALGLLVSALSRLSGQGWSSLGKGIVLYSHGAFLNPDKYSVNGNQLIQYMYLEIVL